eukprot:m.13079 g.13079  ORF g.13079 m.13079 type:complete len:101 (-) comp10089_c0_seq2:3298-3600(-)
MSRSMNPLALVATAVLALATAADDQVQIHPLNLATTTCADGTPARVEYVVNPASSTWVLHLHGGVFCRSIAECAKPPCKWRLNGSLPTLSQQPTSASKTI